jgi:2-dehydropantoate 2-reductase
MQIGIVGAGAIGRHLAVHTSASGVPTVLVDPLAPVDPSRLHARSVDGTRTSPGAAFTFSADPAELRNADAVVVAVKSSATASVATTLASVLPSVTPVVTLQNGLGNVPILRAALGDRVVGGVVTYNVDREGDASVQATSGALYIGTAEGIAGHRLRCLRSALIRAGETVWLRNDIENVMAGKLLLNLNNGVCAATGLGIAGSLQSRDARWIFAQCLREGVRVLHAAGMQPARVTVLPPLWIARVLSLPNALVLRLAHSMVDVDERARSSTLQDLRRGRATEISELNGAIVAIGRRNGQATPVNATVTDVVRDHERAVLGGDTPKYLSARELRERVTRARHF